MRQTDEKILRETLQEIIKKQCFFVSFFYILNLERIFFSLYHQKASELYPADDE